VYREEYLADRISASRDPWARYDAAEFAASLLSAVLDTLDDCE